MKLTVDSGKLTAGWVERKFGDSDLMQIIDGDRGKNYPKQSDFSSEEHCVFLNTKNVRPDGFNFDEVMFIDRVKDETLRKGKLSRRDVILTTRGTIGNIAIYDDNVEFEHIRINSGMLILRPNERVIISEYLFRILLSPIVKSQIARYTSGAAQPQLPIKTLVNFKIPIPPIDEQKRIVAIVDQAFEAIDIAIENTKQNLANNDELIRAIIQSLFLSENRSWKTTTIGEQLLLQRGFDITKKQQESGSVPVVSSGGIKSFHNIAMVKAPGVVIGRKGTLGNVFYMNEDFWPHDTTLWVKDFKGNSPKFVYHFLKTLKVTHLDTGTANPALNRNQIHPIQVNWPPHSEQDLIIKKLDNLYLLTQRLESIYRQKLAALTELKQAILQKAFTGQLTGE